MNKQEIISEGYLADYITGELSDEDIQEVERFISEDLEVRNEYLELQHTVELLAFRYSIPPSQVVKRNIMEDPRIMKSGNFYPSRSKSGFTQILAAASVIIALGSAIAAIYFWNAWRNSEARLTALTLKNIELVENYHIVNQELTNIREDLAVIISPEFSRIILNGTDNAPETKAVIYWSQEYEEVYLNSANLAELPTNQQYQLWALIDGQPVDAGVFDVTGDTFQVMKNIAQADAFAVTVEQFGGSASPTLETMQVYGEI